jgi:integrase
MKIPNPKKTATGKWRIQLRLHGKSVVVSDYDKKKCIALAMAIKYDAVKKENEPANMTLGEAMDKYIESRSGSLSPTTIRSYKEMRKNCYKQIDTIKLNVITQEKIQGFINDLSKTKSPKYVRNVYGLLSAVFREYYPAFRLVTILPQKQKPSINLPNDQDIADIIKAVEGTRIELPVAMALWMGMRVSEIRGATYDCIKGHKLHINKAIVDGESYEPVEKPTKTYSSDRWISIPQYIESLIDALPGEHEGHIVNMSAAAIRNAFYRLQRKNDLPHFTIHSLRHANAAVMLRLGVPNKYAQERGGWATDNVLKTVYQYTMQDEMKHIDDTVNNYFESKRQK